MIDSQEVQTLFAAAEPGLRRVFEFFGGWKGNQDGTMQLQGYMLMGECFGILGKESLKVLFRQAGGGRGMAFESFPESIFLCVVRTAEVESVVLGPSVLDENVLWTRGLRALLRHMLVEKRAAKALGKQMNDFRKSQETLPPFLFAAKAAAAPVESGVSAPANATPAIPNSAAAVDAEGGALDGDTTLRADKADVLQSAVEVTGEIAAPAAADGVGAQADGGGANEAQGSGGEAAAVGKEDDADGGAPAQGETPGDLAAEAEANTAVGGADGAAAAVDGLADAAEVALPAEIVDASANAAPAAAEATTVAEEGSNPAGTLEAEGPPVTAMEAPVDTEGALESPPADVEASAAAAAAEAPSEAAAEAPADAEGGLELPPVDEDAPALAAEVAAVEQEGDSGVPP